MGDIVINVLMTGGRRCGKTSVLAAMQACLQDIVAQTGVSIQPENKHLVKTLNDKLEKNRDIFKFQDKFKSGYVPVASPSSEIAHYKFKLLVENKDTGINVEFHDFPGEFLFNRNETNKKDIEKLISSSNILIFAIDTPHLMEEDGEFDDAKNLQMRLNEFVKNSFFHDKRTEPFLILFVPLKCEKYILEKRMDEVAAQVIKSYGRIINNIKTSAKSNKLSFEMAITPIVTLGGLIFSHFGLDEDGEVKTVITTGKEIPEYPTYTFTKSGYTPKFCEQPLLYVIKFVLDASITHEKKEHKKLKEDGGVFANAIATGIWGGIVAFIAGGAILPVVAVGAAWGGLGGLMNKFGMHSKEKDIKKLSAALSKFTAKIKRSGDGYMNIQ